ncbi:unnamed protein product, partial [Prorocentrum cordatum]
EAAQNYVDRSKNDVMAAIQCMRAQLCSVTFTQHFKTFDLSIERRFTEVMRMIDDQDDKFNAPEKEVENLKQLLGVIKKEGPKAVTLGFGYDRNVGETILVLRSRDLVPKAAMR